MDSARSELSIRIESGKTKDDSPEAMAAGYEGPVGKAASVVNLKLAA
jgi:hypothetical protein